MSDPDWNPPEQEAGYGDPHTPRGGQFRAESQALITASQVWDEVAGALQTTWNYAAKGWGTPGLFGYADALFSAGIMHREINKDLVNAAEDGYSVTTSLANALVETANDFEQTDTTAGNNFRTLQRRA